MIYYQNKPVKVIAVDRTLIGIVWLDRPTSAEIWVQPSDLTADEGIVEILDRAKEVEEWQIQHHQVITQQPLQIEHTRKKK